MKYTITESQYNKIIDKFITSQFEPHEVKTSKQFAVVLWVKDDKSVLEIEKMLGYDDLWVSHEIWDLISDMFSLNFKETQEVIRKWMEEHYNMGGLIPKYGDVGSGLMF